MISKTGPLGARWPRSSTERTCPYMPSGAEIFSDVVTMCPEGLVFCEVLRKEMRACGTGDESVQLCCDNSNVTPTRRLGDFNDAI